MMNAEEVLFHIQCAKNAIRDGRNRTMTDTEKKIAEVLDLSKPVSDCPECGGLGEIRSLGSRRKCECLYIRLKTLKRELDMRREVISELSKERDMYKSSSEVFYERLQGAYEERNRLFERLKDIKSTLGGVTFTDGRHWGAYNALCDIVKDIGGELSK